VIRWCLYCREIILNPKGGDAIYDPFEGRYRFFHSRCARAWWRVHGN